MPVSLSYSDRRMVYVKALFPHSPFLTYPCECLCQLCHGLVEGDVFEEFDPSEKDVDRHCAVDGSRPVKKQKQYFKAGIIKLC